MWSLRDLGQASLWSRLLVSILVLQVLSGAISASGSIILLLLGMLLVARAIPILSVRQFLTSPDFWVSATVLATCLSTVFSTYRENSVIDGSAAVIGGLTYLLLRSVRREQVADVFVAICLWAVFVSASALIQFHSEYLQWRSLEFSQDASVFKRHLPLIAASGAPGTPNYLFIALLASVLPIFAWCLSDRRIYIAVLSGAGVLLLAADVCCTFGRAAYLATAALCLMSFLCLTLCRDKHHKRALLITIGSVFLSFSITALILRRPVSTTFSGMHTLSQKRSAEGRIAIGTSVAAMALSHFSVFGAGPGNFVLACGRLLKDGTLVPQAFNAFLQLLVEQGTVGVSIWLALFFVTGARLIRIVLRDRSSAQASAAVGGIAAIFVYNVFQSALLAGPSPTATTMVFFALSQTQDCRAAAHKNDSRFSPLWIVILCCACWVPPVSTSETTNKQLRDASKLYFSGRQAEAVGETERLSQRYPDNVVVAMVNLRLAAPRIDEELLLRCLTQGTMRPVLHQQGGVQKSLELYRKVAKMRADEDAAFHNAAWLEWMLGDLDSAVKSAKSAVALQPGDAIYRITSGLMMEMSGPRDRAYTEYITALTLDPRILLSRFFRDLGLRDAGIQDHILSGAITRLQAISGDPLSEAKLGALEVFARRAGEGRKHLQDSLALLPSLGGAWLSSAVNECCGGNVQQAKADLSKARFLLRDNDDFYPLAAAAP